MGLSSPCIRAAQRSAASLLQDLACGLTCPLAGLQADRAAVSARRWRMAGTGDGQAPGLVSEVCSKELAPEAELRCA